MEEGEIKIIDLSNKKALEFLELDPNQKGFNPGEFDYLMKQAIFGFRATREIKLNRRMEIDQRLRAVRMAINTPEDRERYIRETSPQLLPELKKRP
jgi:hypothetical protein